VRLLDGPRPAEGHPYARPAPAPFFGAYNRANDAITYRSAKRLASGRDPDAETRLLLHRQVEQIGLPVICDEDLPGWEMPPIKPEMLTPHVGFILDYIVELCHRELRHAGSYGTLWEQWFARPEGEWSERDRRSIVRTFSGLAMLIFPTGEMGKEVARLLLELAIELRLRVRLQLHAMDQKEFSLTSFSYVDGETGETIRGVVGS
jgi:hypothetical protein